MATMSNTHPIMVLAFVLLGAVTVAHVSYLATAPHVSSSDVASVDAGSADGGTVATPNHDPHRVRLVQQATAETVATPSDDPASRQPVQPVSAETIATPNHDPDRVRPVQQATAETVATPNHDPHRAHPVQQATAQTVATPNHDPNRVRPMPSFALNPESLRAQPEAAAGSAPVFVSADTMLYARDSARLRAAPSTAADILTKLAADAPLRAVARSIDRAWWRVSLADGRIGYVHRTAVSRSPVAKTNPPAPAPIVAVASPQPVPASGSDSLLAYVDETMNWFADAAARGSPRSAVRTER